MWRLYRSSFLFENPGWEFQEVKWDAISPLKWPGTVRTCSHQLKSSLVQEHSKHPGQPKPRPPCTVCSIRVPCNLCIVLNAAWGKLSSVPLSSLLLLLLPWCSVICSVFALITLNAFCYAMMTAEGIGVTMNTVLRPAHLKVEVSLLPEMNSDQD